LAWRADMQDTV